MECWLSDGEITQMYKNGTKISVLTDLTGKTKDEIKKIIAGYEQSTAQKDQIYRSYIHPEQKKEAPKQRGRKSKPKKKTEQVPDATPVPPRVETKKPDSVLQPTGNTELILKMARETLRLKALNEAYKKELEDMYRFIAKGD